MNRKALDELAAGYALGALEPDEQRQLDALLAHDPDAPREVAALMDIAAASIVAASPRVTPSAAQRARILAAVKAAPRELGAPEETPLAQGFQLVAASKEGWVETGAPGFRTKLLARGPHPDYEMRLIAIEPGAKVPVHDHAVIEEIYVISGHFQTEGRLLGPGDFFRSEAGTHHHESASPDGCVGLLILRPALAA